VLAATKLLLTCGQPNCGNKADYSKATGQRANGAWPVYPVPVRERHLYDSCRWLWDAPCHRERSCRAVFVANEFGLTLYHLVEARNFLSSVVAPVIS